MKAMNLNMLYVVGYVLMRQRTCHCLYREPSWLLIRKDRCQKFSKWMKWCRAWFAARADAKPMRKGILTECLLVAMLPLQRRIYSQY
jgi:hypothetical protein